MASHSEKSLTSSTVELLVTIDRDARRTLRAQIEDQLRGAIRDGRLKRGARLASTRDLAVQLGVSRPIVIEAYAQLAAEGYVVLRQGTLPRVADHVRAPRVLPPAARPLTTTPRYDFRPGTPDLAAFPRAAWLRSLREALAHMPDDELGYTDQHGCSVLRHALADYLGRVRGVTADPANVLVTSGYAQGRALVCRALAGAGVKRIAIEDPCLAEVRGTVARAGLDAIPIPVDGDGLQVDMLERSGAQALIVTPAHQYPSGAVLSGERRTAVLEWLQRRDALAIEDDYDAEYRYDRAPVGAMQARDPERIIYAGTTSKTLAPALRLGWLVVPPRLLKDVKIQQKLVDYGSPRIEQHAFADFLARGELDRHLRRMRARYRSRRDAMVQALARELPEVQVHGIRAGLHAAVRLASGDARKVREEALRHGIAFTVMHDYYSSPSGMPRMLVMSYARMSEPTIRAGIKALAAVVRRDGAGSRTPARAPGSPSRARTG